MRHISINNQQSTFNQNSASLVCLFWTFLKIGSTAFGGLMSLIAVVENVVVEKMKLLTHEDILDGISLTTFLPGPISTNVVVYVGYRIQGKKGAFVSLLGVILPSFLLVIALTILYFRVGEISTINNLFLGFTPAVAAVILSTAWQMSRKTLTEWRKVAITVIAALLLIGVGGAYITIFCIISSGLVGWILWRNPKTFLRINYTSISRNRGNKNSLFRAILKSQKLTFIQLIIVAKLIQLIIIKIITKSLKSINKLYCISYYKTKCKISEIFPKWERSKYQYTTQEYFCSLRYQVYKKLQISLVLIVCTVLICLAFFKKKLLGKKINFIKKTKFFIFLSPFILTIYFSSSLIFKKYILIQVFVTFATISIVLFGGAYVGIPLIQEIIVHDLHWLTQEEFTYGLAVGQITPGPIVISAAFIGYKVAYIWGAVVATIGIFLPPFILMIAGANLLERFKKSSEIQAAMKGIRPAVIGMIFAAFWIVGKTASPSWISLIIFLVSLFALIRWRINVVWIIPFSGLVGLLFY